MNKKIILVFCGVCLGLILVIISFKSGGKREEAILYSWRLSEVLEDEEKFLNILDDYQIVELYQDFSTEYLEANDATFIKKMQEKKIEVYHLAGDPAWGRKDGAKKIKKEIAKVLKFNEKVSSKIKGIVLDIEPYVSEKEEEFLKEDFKIYVKQIKEAYKYAKEKKLVFRVAIPYWFDKIEIGLLEELIQYTDGISVMNYNIKKTSENIKNEISLAKKYNKQIDTIYEVEYEKEGYFASKSEILKDFEQIKKDNNYVDLQISYHYYGSMK